MLILLVWLENFEIRDLCRDLQMIDYLRIFIFLYFNYQCIQWDWILGKKLEWRKKINEDLERGLGVYIGFIFDLKLVEFLDEFVMRNN